MKNFTINNILNKRIVYHIVLFIFSLLLTVLLYNELIRFPGFFVEDDTFFYAQTAYNIGVNSISSFDGENITDGYYFIWCWMLGIVSFITKIFSSDKSIHLILYFTVYFYFFIQLCISITNNLYQAVVAGIILIVTAFLMEDVFLSVALIYIIKNSQNSHQGKLFYIVLFLSPMIRLDTVIIFITFIAFSYHKNYKKLLIMMLFITTGIICQFILSYSLFDSFISVSSHIKIDQNKDMIQNFIHNIGLYSEFHNLIAYLVFLFALFIVVFQKYLIGDEDKLSLLTYGLLSVAVYYFYLHTNTPHIRQWYLTTIKAVSLYVVFHSIIVSYFEKRVKYFNKIIAFLAIGGFLAFYFVSYNKIRSDEVYTREFISYIKENVHNDDKIFQIDASGIIGYFSERKVTNGDGLINSHEYYKYLSENRLDEYFIKSDFNYVITNREINSRYIVNYYGLSLTNQDLILMIEPNRKLYYDFNVFRLYKLKNRNEDTLQQN